MECSFCGTEFNDTFDYCPECSRYQKEAFSASKLSIFPGFDIYGSMVSVAAGITYFVLILVLLGGLVAAFTMVSPESGLGDETTPTPDIDTETTPVETPTEAETPPTPTPTPTSTPEPTPTPTPTPVSPSENVDEYLLLMEINLESAGIWVVDLEEANGVIELTYMSTAIEEEEIVGEIGFIIGTYLGAVDEGMNPLQMEVTVRDIVSGDDVAEWRINYRWGMQYIEGDLTQDEIAVKAVETIEIID